MPDVGVLNLTIHDNSEQAGKGINNLADALFRVKRAVNGGLNLTTISKGIESICKVVNDSISGSTIIKLSQFGDSISKLKGLGNIKINVSGADSVAKAIESIETNANEMPVSLKMDGVGQEIQAAKEEFGELASTVEEASSSVEETIGVVKEAADGVRTVGEDAGDSFGYIARGAEEATAPVEELCSSVEKVKETVSALGSVKKALQGFGEIASGLFPRVQKFIGQVVRTAKSRMIRTAIRHLTKGFQEGYSNLKKYSELNGTQFFKDAQEMSSIFLQMKNSLAASIAPVLQAALPVLEAITSAAIDALNAVNQLISLLTGKSSWTRATKASADSLDDVKKAAGGAGGAMKELLADFDELNVIASQGGGGGGGGSSDLADYEDMFEEMYEFDEKLRRLAEIAKDAIQFVQDHLGEILAIVGAIGTAILGWKMANAFLDSLGLLSKLGGLIATAGAVLATIVFTWMFTNEYLKTGNVGWLIADALTTAVGATMAWYLAKKFIGGNAGAWAAAITLTLSAIVGIVALLGATDVGALSKESIFVAVENALKLGAAAAILLKTVGGADLGTALQGGAGVALMSFGVIIALKTFLDPNITLFSEDHIKSTLLVAATTFFGMKLLNGYWTVAGGYALLSIAAMVGIEALLDKNVHLFSVDFAISTVIAGLTSAFGLKLIGMKSVMAGGYALLVMSAMIGVEAILDEDIKFFDYKFLLTTLTTGLMTFFGLKLVGLKAMVAGGATLLVMGAMVGIKAELDENIEAFSFEFMSGAVASALLIGFGAYLVGAGASTAGLIALAVFTGLVAIKVMIPKDKIEYGDVELTDEEVTKFVNEKMFRVDVTVSIDRINTTIESTAMNKTEIETKLSELLGTLHVIKLGIDNTDDYAALKSEADSLIAAIQEHVNNAKQEGKLVLQFTPKLVGDSEEEQADWYNSYSSGWDLVDKFFADKGKELGELLVENEKGEIIASKPDLIAEISQQIADVTQAIAKADIISSAYADLKIDIGDLLLGDLTKESVKKVAERYDEYKKLLTEKNKELVEEAYIRQGELVAALGEIDPNSDEYKAAVEKYEEMGRNLEKAVEDGVRESMEPGRNLVLEWITSNHGTEKFDGAAWLKNMISEWFQEGSDVADIIKEVLKENGFTDEELDLMEIVEVTGWEMLKEDMQQKIIQAAVIEPETMQQLKDYLKLSAMEIVTITDWDILTEHEKQLFINNLVSAYGSQDAIEAIKNGLGLTASELLNISGWKDFELTQKIQFISSIAAAYGAPEALAAAMATGVDIKDMIEKGLTSDQEGTRSAANELYKTIKDELEKHNIHISAEAELDVRVNAVVNVVAQAVGGAVQAMSTTATNAKTMATSWFKNFGKHAEGAYGIPRGEIFVANEEGPELIGRIGNKTTVANQQQIVEGISVGVENANESQNVLLREQNSLLRQILQKDTTVKLCASTALGREVKKSLDMYNAVGG